MLFKIICDHEHFLCSLYIHDSLRMYLFLLLTHISFGLFCVRLLCFSNWSTYIVREITCNHGATCQCGRPNRHLVLMCISSVCVVVNIFSLPVWFSLHSCQLDHSYFGCSFLNYWVDLILLHFFLLLIGKSHIFVSSIFSSYSPIFNMQNWFKV